MQNQDKFKDVVDFASLIKDGKKIDSRDENKIIISTKANTLKALKPLLKKSKIEEMFVFTVPDWKNKKADIIKKVKQIFSPHKIVIRSSAVNEDTLDNSMAGCFDSMLNVDSDNENEVEAAIKKVIDSYKNKASESSFNQVLIQPQTKDIVISGVVFTRTLEANGPYYAINYDDSTGETDTVTKGVENKMIKISKFAENRHIPKIMQNILNSVKEIEE